MKQITFSDMEYGNRKRTTKREEFLDIMEEIIPWVLNTENRLYAARLNTHLKSSMTHLASVK